MARRRSRLVAVVVVLLTGLVAAVLVYSGVRQTRVVVDAETTGRVVSEGLFGANHRYPFDAFGSFTRGGEPQQRLVASARSVGMSMLGPDEHMALVEQMGAETTMVVNFATATPQEAADWVSYMNAPVGTSPWADLRAEHGHPEPYGVTWWEVGNEPDVGDQAYWMEQDASILPGEHPERAHKYAYGGTTEFTDQRHGARRAGPPKAGTRTWIRAPDTGGYVQLTKAVRDGQVSPTE